MAILSSVSFRGALIGIFISTQLSWVRELNKRVPAPYLDEVFHVPQAQAYWAGRWSHWDNKITTPPGLYFSSYVFNAVARLIVKTDPAEMVAVANLRLGNAFLLQSFVVILTWWALATGRPVNSETVLQRELVVAAFPLLAFFSGLYYTDVLSAWTVVVTFTMWEASRQNRGLTKTIFQILHVLVGLLSLASRQTNIFWVAIFLGGLQVVDAVQSETTGAILRDPAVSDATIEDAIRLIFQLLSLAVPRLPVLVLHLWPQLSLLASFAAFVHWNGGVVLGDKSNHVATIHTPQLLYIWPCFIFFSWPTLLPRIVNLRQLRQGLPRMWLVVLTIVSMVIAVRYNTIVHPFTLADNRHYVFYVFRILTRSWWIKYAAVPVYFICGWLVIAALGKEPGAPGQDDDTVRLSFVLVWFVSTALSLVTAPLVEPRYFIVPWLVWRMYLPQSSVREKILEGKTKGNENASGLTKILANYSLWIELAWYMLINYVTCWMFLERGFAWPQEPGKVQRFMW